MCELGAAIAGYLVLSKLSLTQSVFWQQQVRWRGELHHYRIYHKLWLSEFVIRVVVVEVVARNRQKTRVCCVSPVKTNYTSFRSDNQSDVSFYSLMRFVAL